MPSHKISTAELRLCVLTNLANYLPYTAKVLLRVIAYYESEGQISLTFVGLDFQVVRPSKVVGVALHSVTLALYNAILFSLIFPVFSTLLL